MKDMLIYITGGTGRAKSATSKWAIMDIWVSTQLVKTHNTCFEHFHDYKWNFKAPIHKYVCNVFV
jgi:hypothetical protein